MVKTITQYKMPYIMTILPCKQSLNLHRGLSWSVISIEYLPCEPVICYFLDRGAKSSNYHPDTVWHYRRSSLVQTATRITFLRIVETLRQEDIRFSMFTAFLFYEGKESVKGSVTVLKTSRNAHLQSFISPF